MNTNKTARDILKELNFCVIDLETTGGNPQTEQIIEIGLVKIEDLKITEELNFLVNPEKTIPDFVQKLTGIKTDDVKNAPKVEEVLDQVKLFIGDSILVAHNISFDIPFLNGILKKYQHAELENKVICTNIMTKYMIPDIVSTNLNFMSQIFNLEHSNAHRAIDDARATAELFLTYLKIFENKGLRKINQLYYPRNHFELDRLHLKNTASDVKVLTKLLKTEHRNLYLTLKSDQGVILFAMPITDGPSFEKKLNSFLDKFNWKNLTIKLVGPISEAFIYLNDDLTKIPEDLREITFQALKEFYPLQNEEIPFFDFLVTPHLIQGQLIIYPNQNLNHQQKLIFKYPAHKKKLGNYLNSHRTNNLNKKKKTKISSDPLRHFFSYIVDPKQSHLPYLKFQHPQSNDELKQVFKEIDNLAKTNPNFYHFPESYL